MARTDEDGKSLQVVLSWILNRTVAAKEIYGGLGIARNTYHNRIEEESYPNAEECRLLARHFGLNSLDLQLRFGLITDDELAQFRGGVITEKPPAVRNRRLPKISEMSGNPDVSSL